MPGNCRVAIDCRPKAQVSAALWGLKDLTGCWLYVKWDGPTSPLAPSISTENESRVAPCFKLLRGIEQDLRTCIFLLHSSNVVHEGDIVELLGPCNTVTDA